MYPVRSHGADPHRGTHVAVAPAAAADPAAAARPLPQPVTEMSNGMRPQQSRLLLLSSAVPLSMASWRYDSQGAQATSPPQASPTETPAEAFAT